MIEMAASMDDDHFNFKKKQKPDVPVDKGWAWWVMFGYFITIFVVVSWVRALTILLPVLLDKYQQSTTMTTLAFGISEISESLANILLPLFFIKRFSVRSLTLFGGIAKFSAILSLCISPNIVLLNAAFAVLGFGRGFIMTPPIYLLGFYFDKRHSLASSLANTGLSLGTLVSPLLTQLLVTMYGLWGTFLVFGAITMHTMVASMLYRPMSMYSQPSSNDVDHDTDDKNTDHQPPHAGVSVADEHGEKRRQRRRTRLCACCKSDDDNFSVLTNPTAVCILMAGVVGTQIQCSNVYMGVLGLENGLDSSQVPWLLITAGVCDCLGKLFYGMVADRGFLSPIKIVCLTQLMVGLLFQFLSFFKGMASMIILCIVMGSNASMLLTLHPRISIQYIGLPSLPFVTSTYNVASCAITFLCHLVIGSIKDNTGSFVGGYQFLGAMMLASVPLILLARFFASRRKSKSFEKNCEECDELGEGGGNNLENMASL